MAIESRIEADLSGQNTSSQSRIEQILNGEQITPRSRIEQLLQEYNPEDPGAYHKVECTKAQYDNMQSHSSNTIYVVTYPDQSVHFYLGDDEIAGNPTLIEKRITENGIYDAEDESADGYSIVDVSVAQNYSDVSCTKAQYDAMQSHDSHTIYTVTDGNKVYKYLGDDQIGFGEIPETDRTSISGGTGYRCVNDLNASGYYPIDWTKAWTVVVCFYLVSSSLPSAFSSNYFLFGGTGGWAAYTRVPALEFANNHMGLLIGTGSGWASSGGGWFSGDSFAEFMNLCDPSRGYVNYLKIEYVPGNENQYRWYHSKDGKNYTLFAEITSASVQYQNYSNDIQFTFGYGDRKNIPQGDGFYILFDRCALYSEDNLIFGREAIPTPKNFAEVT